MTVALVSETQQLSISDAGTAYHVSGEVFPDEILMNVLHKRDFLVKLNEKLPLYIPRAKGSKNLGSQR